MAKTLTTMHILHCDHCYDFAVSGTQTLSTSLVTPSPRRLKHRKFITASCSASGDEDALASHMRSFSSWCQKADTGLLDSSYFPGVELRSMKSRGAELLYKPYMDFLWRSLIDSASGLKCQELHEDIRFNKSNKGKDGAEVHNWLLKSSYLRRIRLTYFNAGASGQAFNSVLYPDYGFDFPLLGIDLLSFGKGKLLCVVDFLPLSQDPSYLEKYTAGLHPIRKDFAEYCTKMSRNIYNENEFFSKQLIFYRSDKGASDEHLQVPDGLLFKVYMGYVTSYLSWLHALEPKDDPCFMEYVKKRQADYDAFSCEHDPAMKLFSVYFGQKWSERMAEFLFSLASH